MVPEPVKEEPVILILKFAFLFLIGALAGWILEFIYRHFLSRNWVNPGFLNGPWLPIYGFGTVILYLFSAWTMPLGWKIAGIVVFMTLLELIAGLIFTTFFNIRLWDYSDRKFNFRGIICPLYSFFWGVLGVLFTFLVYPFLKVRLDHLMAHLYLSFFLGIFYGFLLVDLFSALGILSLIREGLKDAEAVAEKLHVNYERLKLDLRGWVRENTSRSPGGRFLAPFNGHVLPGVKSLIREQAEKRREELLKKLPLKRKGGKSREARASGRKPRG